MTWQLTSDISAFAENAGPFLRSSPVRHTVLLTVLAALRSQGPHVYGEDDPVFGWWTSADGAVSGALLQTPPFPLTLTEVPPEAVPAAATALAAYEPAPSLPAANLLVDDVPAFTAAWQSHVGGTARAGRHGFGAAATTAATRNALNAGAAEVVLFTDLANPTSNALYPRLGYRPIEDRAVVEFSR